MCRRSSTSSRIESCFVYSALVAPLICGGPELDRRSWDTHARRLVDRKTVPVPAAVKRTTLSEPRSGKKGTPRLDPFAAFLVLRNQRERTLSAFSRTAALSPLQYAPAVSKSSNRIGRLSSYKPANLGQTQHPWLCFHRNNIGGEHGKWCNFL